MELQQQYLVMYEAAWQRRSGQDPAVARRQHEQLGSLGPGASESSTTTTEFLHPGSWQRLRHRS
jgi:hypothetical protein